jgi:hypothetical protein
MSNYQNGKIYKIVDNTNGNIYIGSTYQTLQRRLSGHIKDFQRYLKDCKCYNISSFEILQNNNYSIELIELYPCNSKQELIKREGHYIKSLECVNKCVAGRTNAEYRIDNKDKILEYNKQYRIDNKDKISEVKKQYREENKKEIANYKKQEMICVCGAILTINHKARHEKAHYHKSFIQKQQIAIN